jgi:hypothetical protein
MAIRQIIQSITQRQQKPADQAPDLQVDFSYTQWRHAQMEQAVRNYQQACDVCEGAPA